MAKRFFYTCAGILCLVFAYHLGARDATAQGEAKGRLRFVEAWSPYPYVMLVTNTDDIYVIDPTKLHDVAKGTGWWKFNLDAVK